MVHLQTLIVWLLHPKENMGLYPPKAIVSATKEEEELPCTHTFLLNRWDSASEDGQVKAKWGCWLTALCSELGPTAQKPAHCSGEHSGVRTGCPPHLGMNGFLVRRNLASNEGKAKNQGSHPTEGKRVRDKELQHPTPRTAFCLRSPRSVSVFC